jgi:hypothetical protein
MILIRVYFYFTHSYGELTSDLALVRWLGISAGKNNSNALGLKLLERNDKLFHFGQTSWDLSFWCIQNDC